MNLSVRFAHHILIVDDDTRIRKLLDKYLTAEKYLISEAKNAFEAEALMQLFRFDLIVTDNMMPGKDGIHFITDLKKAGNETPIIMLTALGDIDNRLLGLAGGADDYISKPFNPKELSLRIINILKRVKPLDKKLIQFLEYSFDINTQILKKHNKIVNLTSEQKGIMNLFMNNLNKTIARLDILAVLGASDERAVDVAINRLRKKFDDNHFIITERNVGYKFII